MKRKLAMLCAICIGMVVLGAGCGKAAKSSGKLQVVCTIFPEYDWVRELTAGVDGIEVTMLVKNGTDLHNYQPSVQDIAAISSANVFCYVGGVSDAWAADVLQTAANDTIQTVSLVEAADADEEVIVEGMQEEHDHDHDDGTENYTAVEVDEHVWLSLERAVQCCQAIRDALVKADPVHAQQYKQNCEAYTAELNALDEKYETMTEHGVRDVIVVPDRFPFRYLADDYDLTYYAAFPGCSAETEASFETIAFLAEKVQSLQLPCVLVTETSDQSLAKTVLKNANSDGEIYTLHAMQSVSQQQVEEGVTYLSIMEQNLTVLQEALTAQ